MDDLTPSQNGAPDTSCSTAFSSPSARSQAARAIRLRIDPTGNNQAQGIKWARDHELETAIVQPRARLDDPRPTPAE